MAIAGAEAAAGGLHGGESCRCQRMRGGLGGVLAFFDDEPGLAKLCVVGAGHGRVLAAAGSRLGLTRM